MGILNGWFLDPLMPCMGPPQPPTDAKPVQQPNKLPEKEKKWGLYRDAPVLRLKALEEEGWALVYSDGSAKTVRGRAHAGYGVWFGPGSPCNVAAHVLLGESRVSVEEGCGKCCMRSCVEGRGRRWQ